MVNEILKKSIQGFSLIELMVVVAIIGILSSVAVPAYDAYMVRSRMTHLITVAREAKNAISENRIVQGVFPNNIKDVYSVPSSKYYNPAGANFPENCATGKNQLNYTFKIEGNGTVFPENEVTIVMAGAWKAPTADAAGSLDWTCNLYFKNGNANVSSRYVPGGVCTIATGSAPDVNCT